MSYEFYKMLHVIGLLWAFASLGGLIVHVLNGGNRESNSANRLLAISHGVSLLVVFVSGFGMHAKLGIQGFPGWFILKILLFFVVGGMVRLPYLLPAQSKTFFFLLPALAALGAWLALYKPF